MTWDEDAVNQTLERVMTRAFDEVWNKSQDNHTTMRTGAYMVALNRIVKAKKIRGVFP
jgi:glutamate dehydrogenase/leucine dehydrogenase